jgi:hypothetical protein
LSNSPQECPQVGVVLVDAGSAFYLRLFWRSLAGHPYHLLQCRF